MNRRSFLKGAVAFLGICYVNPTALVTDVPKKVGNHFITPQEMAADCVKMWNCYYEEEIFRLGSLSDKEIAA